MEALYHPTVHLKGVITHYTLQTKACEKEYEQIVSTPFVFLCKQNLLYGNLPLRYSFLILTIPLTVCRRSYTVLSLKPSCKILRAFSTDSFGNFLYGKVGVS